MDTIKALQDTLLKKFPKQGSELSDSDKSAIASGKEYQVESYEEAENGHYKVTLGYDAGVWFIFSGHWQTPWEDQEDNDFPTEIFTAENLEAIMPIAAIADIQTYCRPLNQVCQEFDIQTVARAAAFIAQVAHESGSLKYKEEIASGEAYEGRKDLGNTQPGDGKRFKGKGLIQLTGRANYRECGKALNLPLEQNPGIAVSDPLINTRIAGWYWDSRGLNAFADKGDFETITRRINGGLNGYADRCAYWGRAKRVLGQDNVAVPTSWDKVNWGDMSAQVSKYFTVREVTNGETRRIPTDISVKQNCFNLAIALDKVRENWGSGIIVTSWYRPPAVNKAVGGVSNSQHILGLGVDIRPANGKGLEFEKWLDTTAWKDKALGWGQRAGRGFTHLDLRPGNIRWNY